jgi:transcriptional regulator with XRE-family HTH domain
MTLTDDERREIGLAREFQRKRADLTQQELADTAGLNVNVVRRAENGEPVADTELRQIARALAVEFALYADGRVTVAPAPSSAGATP